MLFVFIFALLGMELFANRALVNEAGDLIRDEPELHKLYASQDFEEPRLNFDNLGYAITTIFVEMIGEDWNWTMYEWVRAYGNGSKANEFAAIIFFLLIMILGNVVLFSLFTAILLRNFEGGDEKDTDSDDEEDED